MTLILLLFFLSAQSQTENYQSELSSYSPKYSSIESCIILQNSLSGNIYTNPDFNLKDQNALFEDWQLALEKSEDDLNASSFFINVGAGVFKTLKDGTLDLAFENPISKSTSKVILFKPFLKSLLDRVGESSIEYFQDKLIETKKLEFEQNIKRILDQSIVSYRFNNGIIQPDSTSINQLYRMAVNSEVDQDNYPILNKLFLEKGIEFIKINQEQILENIKNINSLTYETNKLKEQFKGISGQVFVNESNIQKNKEEIQKLRKVLKTELNTKIDNLSKSLEKVSNNQLDNFETIEKIKAIVKKNEESILRIQENISEQSKDIKSINNEIEKHEKLIAENKFYIDIISQYTYESLSLEGKIKSLENESFPWMKKLGNRKDSLISELKSLEEKEDFVRISNTYLGIANKTQDVLIQQGWLKGDDAKEVGEFMKYINSSVNIGIAYASPNPLTISNAVLSTISLFGNVSNEPSPEMQAIQVMYKRMIQEFSNLNNKIDIIDEKIDTLISLNIKIHDNLISAIEYNREYNEIRFNNLGNEIKIIQDKLEGVDYILKLNLVLTDKIYKEKISTCNSADLLIKELKDPIDNYDGLKAFYKNCSSCTHGLIYATSQLDKGLFLLSKSNFEGIQKLEEVKASFELYNKIYNRKKDFLLISNSIPVTKIDQRNEILNQLSNGKINLFQTDVKDLNLNDATSLDSYIHPSSLINFVRRYTNFVLPFYEFLDYPGSINQSDNFLSLPDYLNLKEQEKQIRLISLQEHIKFLIETVEIAIIQQSILSGVHLFDKIYYYLYNSSDDELLLNCIKALESNPVLAYNFAKYAMNSNLVNNSVSANSDLPINKFYRLVDSIINNGANMSNAEKKEKVATLNSLSLIKPLKFEYFSSNNSICFAPEISIKNRVSNQKDNIRVLIKIPSKNEVLSQNITYTRDLNRLSILRNELISIYYNISVLQHIGSSGLVDDSDYKNLLFIGN